MIPTIRERLARTRSTDSERVPHERRSVFLAASGSPVPFDRRRTSTPPPPISAAPLEWLDAGAATRYLGLPSRRALYQAIRRGQVPMHRFGKRRMRFRRIELDHVLERGRQTAALDCG